MNDRWIKLDDVVLWDANPNQGDVVQIALSIKQHGYNRVIGLWEDAIVKVGNHTVKALTHLRRSGWNPFGDGVRVDDDDVWWVRYLDITHLDQVQSNSFAIADNRASELSSRDEQLLAELLTEIANQDDISLPATGYDQDELDRLFHKLADSVIRGGGMELDPGNAAASPAKSLDDYQDDDDDESDSFEGGASYVRMVQLFFNQDSIDEFNDLTTDLKERFGTGTLTDTVMEAVRYAHRSS